MKECYICEKGVNEKEILIIETTLHYYGVCKKCFEIWRDIKECAKTIEIQ